MHYSVSKTSHVKCLKAHSSKGTRASPHQSRSWARGTQKSSHATHWWHLVQDEKMQMRCKAAAGSKGYSLSPAHACRLGGRALHAACCVWIAGVFSQPSRTSHWFTCHLQCICRTHLSADINTVNWRTMCCEIRPGWTDETPEHCIRCRCLVVGFRELLAILCWNCLCFLLTELL